MKTQTTIENKLKTQFEPTHLEVINESHQHNVPPGSESHFRVTIVSENFETQSLIQRHRSIHDVLQQELKEGIHALALHTYSPTEWSKNEKASPNSPPCLGGSKHG